MVQVPVPPAGNGPSGLQILATARSAESSTMVDAWAVLLLWLGSIDPEVETVAVLVMPNGPPWLTTAEGSTATLMTTVRLCPLGMSPRSQVSVPVGASVQALRSSVTKLTSAGRVSTTLTFTASSGP